jgi:CubicO group peptidase (beta-lactamase class C family)
MRLTGFSQRPDTLGREAASGHSGGAPVTGGFFLHPELAAAGMWSTSTDLARFGLALGASLQGDSGGLLRETTMREAVRRQMGDWGLGFALGGGAGDSATFGHDGSTAGFTARLVMFADGRRGLAVMTNGESEALINEIQRSVAAAYGWPVPARPVRTVVHVAPEQLTRLTGRYRIVVDDRTIDVGFRLAGDRLAFVGQSGQPTPLYAESPNRFFSRESGTTFTFDTDEQGPARRVTIDQTGQRFVAERLP